jgi:acetyl-CoA C-acetyltransferase
MTDHDMPVLVGVGQVTERDFDENSSSPLDLMEQAVLLAVADAGINKSALADLDTLAVVKSFREPTRNSPESLANRLGATRATQWLMPDGGNGPQYLVNRFSEAIARGESRFVLFAGSEAMATGRKIVKSTGNQPAWQEPASSDPVYLVADTPLSTEHEDKHGLRVPSGFYAMSENALRHHYGRSIADHQADIGKLFSRFTEVAAASPHAWYPIARTPEEIANPSDRNRFVSWPYTKYMNAMNQINQSAALLLTSVAHARQLGIAEDRFIYLHGCSDTKEKGITERPNYHSSQAMQVMAEQVFKGNELSISDMAYIDFYSCFPSAVQMARDVFGMRHDDPRHLTVTGGLPFHGGAGNNYVMNSIATMVDKLRADPGKYGLVTANGGYFSKHAAGIYSTNPVSGTWRRTDPAVYQKEIDDAPNAPFTETPAGDASIETYTVAFGRDNEPAGGSVIGRLGDFDDPDATRFVSVLPADRDLLLAMTREDMVGSKGTVSLVDDLNIFSPSS